MQSNWDSNTQLFQKHLSLVLLSPAAIKYFSQTSITHQLANSNPFNWSNWGIYPEHTCVQLVMISMNLASAQIMWLWIPWQVLLDHQCCHEPVDHFITHWSCLGMIANSPWFLETPQSMATLLFQTVFQCNFNSCTRTVCHEKHLLC